MASHAAGKQVAEFNLKITSVRLSDGPGGCTVLEVNVEGSARDSAGTFGTAQIVEGGIFGTLTVVGSPKGGTFRYLARAHLDNGTAFDGTDTGTYELVDGFVYHTTGVLNLPDGRRFVSDGRCDVAARSWTGKIFAIA